MAQQVEMKQRGGVCIGVLAGCTLLLFAGALVATTQMPGMGEANGRFLQAAPVAPVAPTIVAVGAETTPLPSMNVQTIITMQALKGSLVVIVKDASKFVVGEMVQIAPGSSIPEMPHHLEAVDATLNSLLFKVPLEHDHGIGEIVALIPEDSADQSANQISSGSSGSLKSVKDSSGSSLNSFDSLKSSESGSSEGNLMKAGANGYSAISGGSWLLQFLLAMCYACAYKSKVVEPMGVMRHQPLQHEMHNDFRFGLCDCFKDFNICLMVCCCPYVRMAHTNEAADVCGFWESLACLWCSSLCLFGPLCAQVYFRIHIKDHMGIQDHCFNDFCTAFFCLPCITGQQAMAVDEVLGWKFKCPCTVEHVSSSGGYGQAGMMG